MPNKYWSPELTKKLIELIGLGYTFRECAIILGVSRNSVIGKCNRLNLYYSARIQRSKILSIKKNKNDDDIKIRVVPKKYLIKDNRKIEIDKANEPVSLQKQLLDLKDNECRYAYDNPSGKGYLFCANQTVMGSSYCQHHHHVCFNTPKKSKNRAFLKDLSAIRRKRFVKEAA